MNDARNTSANARMDLAKPLGKAGAPAFAERWPNAKVAKVAHLIGRGYSFAAIASELGDGTTPNALSSMAAFWGLTANCSRHTYSPVTVELAAKDRTRACEEARRRRQEMNELLADTLRVVVRDRLWTAILEK